MNLLSQWRAYCPSGLGVSIGFASEALREQWIRNPNDSKKPFFLHAPLQKVRYYGKAQRASSEEKIEGLLKLEAESALAGVSGEPNYRVLAAVMPIVKGAEDVRLAPLMEGAMNAVKNVEEKVEGKPFSFTGWTPGSTLAVWALNLSPHVKDDAFKEEVEWRKLVSKDHRLMPGQKFRQGRTTLIPFVEIILDMKASGAGPVLREKYFIDEVIIGPTPDPHLTEEAIRALFASEGHPEVHIRPSRIPFKDW